MFQLYLGYYQLSQDEYLHEIINLYIRNGNLLYAQKFNMIEKAPLTADLLLFESKKETILKNKSNFGSNIQQSDYQFNWKNLSNKKVHGTKLTRIKNKFRELKVLYGFAKFIYNIYKYLFRKNSNRLNSRNKNISTITVTSLLK